MSNEHKPGDSSNNDFGTPPEQASIQALGPDPSVSDAPVVTDVAAGPNETATVQTPAGAAAMSQTRPQERSTATRIFHGILDSSAITILFAVVMALIISAVLIAAAKLEVREAASYIFARPGDFFGRAWDAIFSAYSALFRGGIFDYQAEGVRRVRPFTESLVAMTPLVFAGLGLGVAFRSGMFNIGAQGQVLVGAVAGTLVGFTFDLPAALHLPLACLAAVLIGGLWAGIAGILKATTGANEVIVTIMLNSIAIYLVSYLLTTRLLRQGGTRPISPAVAESATFPLILPAPFRLHAGFLLALVAAAFIWWLMERSRLGFQFRAVGANQFAAKTAGIRVTSMYVMVMLVAGGLAGLGGASQVLGVDKTVQASSAGSIGFDAITVALLGRSKPLGIIGAAFLFGVLRAGSPLMQTSAGTPIDIVQVIQASIVLLIAAPVLVRELSIFHRIASLTPWYSVKGATA